MTAPAAGEVRCPLCNETLFDKAGVLLAHAFGSDCPLSGQRSSLRAWADLSTAIEQKMRACANSAITETEDGVIREIAIDRAVARVREGR